MNKKGQVVGRGILIFGIGIFLVGYFIDMDWLIYLGLFFAIMGGVIDRILGI